MRRASWGWVILFLAALLFVPGCRLRGEATEGPATPSPATGEPTQVASNDAPGSLEATPRAQLGDEKPAKPVASLSPTPALAEAAAAPDPALDDWTVMVYMSATEALDAAALEALNGLEAAGASQGVNVLVQLDRDQESDGANWNGARRYYVAGAEEDGEASLQMEERLGAVNMGDPDSLTDFVTWAQRDYPANHYALVIWGESRGWRGLAVDSGDEDDLSMADLSGGLARALAENGDLRLDLIVLDGALTAGLELLNTVAPHARYVVASPAMVAPRGGSMQVLFEALYAAEELTPAQFAQAAAAVGQESAPPAPGLAAAFDLHALPAVNEAMQGLSDYLAEKAQLSLPAFDAARRSAQIMTLSPPGNADLFAALELKQFAEQLASQAADPTLVRRAEALDLALDRLLVEKAAAGSTLTIASLPPAQIDDAVYAELDEVGWQQAQRAVYEARAGLVAAMQGWMALQNAERVGANDPALVGVQLRTLTEEEVNLAVLHVEEGGRERLLALEQLLPGAATSPGATWPIGVSQTEVAWDATAPYLSSGANGDFTPLWPVPGEASLLMAPVRYTAADGATAQEAALLLEASSGALHGVWQSGGEGDAPGVVALAAGDSLQLLNFYLEADARLSAEPGVTLVYSDGVDIKVELFPLPTGDYRLGLVAGEGGQGAWVASQPVAVNNEELTPGYQAYLNATYGFRFLYPLAWPAPFFDGQQVVTTAEDRGPTLMVSIYPETAARNAAQLKTQALEIFGELDLLYEEAVRIGEEEGLFTVYGYDAADGPHTGVFVAFVHDGTGYVVDVDGLALDEETTVETARQVVASWRFVPIRSGAWSDAWRLTQTGAFSVTLPVSYTHSTLENGWELFRDGDRFLALRRDAVSGEGLSEIADHWANVAAAGVEGFEAEVSEAYTLGRSVWSRVTFGYEGDDGAVAGLILATVYGGEEIVAWVEAPAAALDPLMDEQLLAVVAGLLPPRAAASGVLYAATFDEEATWGVGQQDGVLGRVQDGVYELLVEAERGFFWTSAGVSFGEAAYEVELVQTAGSPNAGYGLLFGANGETESFALFQISGDGYVWIGECRNNCTETTTLVGDGWFATEAIARGLGARNHLRVVIWPSEMVFYVNDVEVAVLEGDYPVSGDVGLAAETFGEGALAVQFDNLRVSSP